MREWIKGVAGSAVSQVSPQCRYDQAIFVLAHMRCGSTALSNIFCSRPDVSGYGEAHVRYLNSASLGRLVVNQAVRKSWKRSARHLFDKVLHNRHDAQAPDTFFSARAVFVARPPGATVRSIRALYAGLGRTEYNTDESAAQYYVERVSALVELWDRFDPARRVGLTYSQLMQDPDAALAQISTSLSISPPLENRYESRAASRKGGAGDPVVSGRFTRIEPRQVSSGDSDPVDDLEISDEMKGRARMAFDDFVQKTQKANVSL